MSLFANTAGLPPGLAAARQATDAVIARAEELGLAVSVAVVDAQGHEVLAVRMDGAAWFTPAVARAKARSAIALGGDSEDLASFSSMVGPGIMSYVDEQLPFAFTAAPGGVVARRGEQIIAAVGVSGAPAELDAACARAGAAAISS